MKSSLLNEKTVLFLTIVISLIGIYNSFQSGNILAYNDAAAHLNTARRVFDNLTPGLVQLGSVWLPLLHIVLLPFVAFDFLWRSGLAGSIVSGISFVVAAIFLYRLLFLITENIWASIIGVLAFTTNLNLLYLQSTAMFEPLLIATAIPAVYFLAKWMKEQETNSLVLAAFSTMLATITRYDGWALFIAACILVSLTNLKKGRSKEGPLILFFSLAGFGIALWLLYNYLIFSDPLYFARSEYSAAAQQQIISGRGQLLSKGNLLNSIQTYTLASFLNLGLIPTILSLIGLVYYLRSSIRKPIHWPILLLLVPFVFNIVSLYQGQSVIWLPMLPPYFDTFFNARYGVLMIPAAAFFIGYLALTHKITRFIIPLLLAAQIYLTINPSLLPLFGSKIGVIAIQDTVSSVNHQTKEASLYLKNNYTGGLILVSSASMDAFIFRAGLPLKSFITEGTGYYWKESLDEPTKHATWIVFFRDKSDRVGRVVSNWDNLDKFYALVYQDQTYQIWKKV